MCACVCVCMCMCVHVCMCVCTCVCMHVCVCACMCTEEEVMDKHSLALFIYLVPRPKTDNEASYTYSGMFSCQNWQLLSNVFCNF